MPNKLGEWDWIGDDDYEFSNYTDAVTKVTEVFTLKIQERARLHQVIDTGAMIRDLEYKRFIADEKVIVEIFMNYYADFVNQGVKGWGDSSNAPNSEYQYKSLGMPKDARKKIMDRLKRQGAILTDKSKKKKVGLEKKGEPLKKKTKKSILEKKADRVVYLIKRFGIKETHFIDEAFNDTIEECGDIIESAFMGEVFLKLKEK